MDLGCVARSKHVAISRLVLAGLSLSGSDHHLPANMRLHKEQPPTCRSRTAGPFFKSLPGVLSTYMSNTHIFDRHITRLHTAVTEAALRGLDAAPTASRQSSWINGSTRSLQSVAAVIETDACLPYQRSVRACDYTQDYIEQMDAASIVVPSTASTESSLGSTPGTSISGLSMLVPDKSSDDRARSNSTSQQPLQLAQLHEGTLTGLANRQSEPTSSLTTVDMESTAHLPRRMYTDRASKYPVPPIPQEYLSEANQHINSTLPLRPPIIQERVSSARGQTKPKFRTTRLKSLSRHSKEDCAVTPRTERMNAFVGEAVGTAKPVMPIPPSNPGHGATLPETGFLQRLQQIPNPSLPYLQPEHEDVYEPEFLKVREYCAPPPPSFTSLNYGQTRVIHPRPATSPRVHSFVAKSWRSRSLPRLVPTPNNDQWTIDSSNFKSNRDDEPRFASLGAFLDGYDDASEMRSSPDLLVSDEVLGKSDTALDGMIRDLAVDIGELNEAEASLEFSQAAYGVDVEHDKGSFYDFDDSTFQARIFYNGRLRRPASICNPKG